MDLQAGISTDIDGQNRSLVSPAIGADEPGNLPLAGPVWPGDCDADLHVSTLDWLHLGVAIGQNLRARPGQICPVPGRPVCHKLA